MTAVAGDFDEDFIQDGLLIELANRLVTRAREDWLTSIRWFCKQKLGTIPKIVMRESDGTHSPYPDDEQTLYVILVGKKSADLYWRGQDVRIGPQTKEPWQK